MSSDPWAIFGGLPKKEEAKPPLPKPEVTVTEPKASVTEGGTTSAVAVESPLPQPGPPPPSTPTPTPIVEFPAVPPTSIEEKVEEAKPTPTIAPPTFPQPATIKEYDLTEAKPILGVVITQYGLKGTGKTMNAMYMDGAIVFLSFDYKSYPIWANEFNKNPRIKVFDASRYYSEASPTIMLQSAETNFTYLQELLEKIITPLNPDWIVIDGSEIMQKQMEMVMRNRQGLMPFEGVKNLNIWKERNMYLDQIHYSCLRAVKKGLIYNTYTDEHDVVVKDSVVVVREKVPKWIGTIMSFTDVVIYLYSELDRDGKRRFMAHVESSKMPKFIKTGTTRDVTGVGIKGLMKAG